MEIKNKKKESGGALIYLIVVIFVFAMIMLPVVSILAGKLKLAKSAVQREMSLQIAEAGIDYYRWRLAHFPGDYEDGRGQPGPYLHDYTDKDTQNIVGKFSLSITPPLPGSTLVVVESTGWTAENPEVKRIVKAKFGNPSLAQYAFLSNDIVWIGAEESVSGKIHSNNGIRFDGYGNAPITSSKETYICSVAQGSGCPASKDGIWGSAKQEVKNFWEFPVPTVDFSSLTSDIAGMKSLAQSGGVYLPPSSKKGYSIVFNGDGTFSAYKVTKLLQTPTGWDVKNVTHEEDVDYQTRSFQFTEAIPSNGIIFVEDNAWVEGIVNGRATVVAARLPYDLSLVPTIYIPNNIVYNEKDGTSVLGLISQGDIVVTYNAPENIEINAAMVSQNGSCQIFYYQGHIKGSITIFGSIMTYGQWTWSWLSSGSVVSGYRNTYSNYDVNLVYSPPPSFPVSASGYHLLEWSSD